jgi:hypothetical protein
MLVMAATANYSNFLLVVGLGLVQQVHHFSTLIGYKAGNADIGSVGNMYYYRNEHIFIKWYYK